MSRRTAVSTIAANTGFTSVGEPLITRRMSAVAVWRASASCVSLNRRAFWIAIAAWSANVRTRPNSASENARGGVQMMSIVPMALPLHDIGAFTTEKSPRSRATSVT